MAKKKSKQGPPPPQPRDFNAENAAISSAAQKNAQAQTNQAILANNAFQRQSNQSVENIAANLGDGGTIYEQRWIPGTTTGRGKNKKTTAGRWEKVAIGEAAPNRFTAAAQANLAGAQAGVDQVQSAQTGLGQLREQYAAQEQDPAMRRLNDMAAGQLYRPDQIRAGQIAADQVQGARVADIGNMDYARLGQVADVQGPAGYTADQVRARNIRAAQAAPVQNVESQNIRASAAERGLMNEARGGGLLGELENQASNDLALGRSLSPEQSRDAAQSARAGMTARGLGLGNSALAAEMLNRDRFATQREAERRTFAGNVLNQGTGIRQTANQAYLSRQDMNTGRQLQAALANQSTGLNLGQSNAQLRQAAAIQSAQNQLSAQQANQAANARALEFAQQGGLQASMANQQAGLSQAAEQARLQQAAIGASYDASQQRAMANAGYAQQAALSNQDANLRAAQYNVGQDMAAQQANQQANQQQEQYNRAFLGQVAGMNFDQNQARTSMLSGLYGQQAGLGQTTASLQQGMAQSQVALDPYQRALGSNMPIATIAPSAGLIGQAYGQTMNYGSDLFNTNTNMQASIYNSYQNNRAGIRSAEIQAGATRDAGNSQMMGSMAGASATAGAAAALCWIARACMPTRWRAFRRSMLRHAPDRFIAAYCRHGERLAANLTTPLRRFTARLTLRTLEWSWN